jgi:beta-glucosidase-like glycosyl hydrolase
VYSYGEDPYLNGEFGLIFVNTMQTLNGKGYMKVAATLKHYVYGSQLGGTAAAAASQAGLAIVTLGIYPHLSEMIARRG